MSAVQFYNGQVLFEVAPGSPPRRVAMSANLCCGDCGFCHDAAPPLLKMVIAGVTGGAAGPSDPEPCDECEQLNGTYILSRVGTTCVWTATAAGHLCDWGSATSFTISLAMSGVTGGPFVISADVNRDFVVHVSDPDKITSNDYFKKVLPDVCKVNCEALYTTGVVLPFAFVISSESVERCVISEGVVTVSLPS